MYNGTVRSNKFYKTVNNGHMWFNKVRMNLRSNAE